MVNMNEGENIVGCDTRGRWRNLLKRDGPGIAL